MKNIKKYINYLVGYLLLLSAPSLVLAQVKAAQPSVVEQLLGMVPMFIIVFFIFFFLVIKPQNQKQKEHNDLLSSIKKGDQVVTTGGIVAKVALVEEKIITLEISPNVKLKFEKDHIIKKYTK